MENILKSKNAKTNDNKGELLKKLFPYFFIAYFLINFASYYLGGISQLKGFVDSTWFSLISKGLSYGIFIAYLTLFIYYNKCHLELKYLLLFVFVFGVTILSCVIVPRTVKFITINDYRWTIKITLNVGLKDILIETANWFIDLIVMFSFLFIFRQKISKKYIKPFLIFVVIFTLIEIGYTAIFQYKNYLYLLGMSDIKNPNLSGTFLNKNGFGFLLFQAVIASYFLIRNETGFRKVLCWISYILINIVNICSLCKTSITTILIFNTIIFICYLIKLCKQGKYKSFWTLISCVALIIICGSLMFLPQFKNVPVIGKITSKISSFISYGGKTLQSRFSIWEYATKILKGPFMIFGYGKTTATYFLRAAFNLNTFTFHNGMLSILCSYGVFGLALYFFGIIYLIKLILKINDWHKKTILISIVLVVLLYGLVENVFLFISSSSTMLVANVILSVDNNEEAQNLQEAGA